MKTPQEIRSLANQWALENADETMATNSALNKGFRGGYTQCQEDNADKMNNVMETLLKIRDCKDYGNNSSSLARELIQSLNKK